MALKFIAAVAATAALAFSASAANATVFAGNWSLTVGNNSDPGHLKIFTDTTGGIFSKDLGAPNPEFAYEDLFQMWTNEGTVNPDDLNNTTLSLKFTFTSPDDNNGPIVVDGVSHGYAEVLGFFQGGELIWSNPVQTLEWGHNLPNVDEPGRMTLTVSGGRFNEGGFWSTDQNCNWKGKNCQPQGEALGVTAKFEWDNDPTFSAIAAPEPGTWALMIGGFGMAGAAIRRRRSLATA